LTRGRDLALAAASGLVLGAAFLPRVPGALAWVAFVPLLLALERRVAGGRARSWFTLGFAGGLVFFLVGTHWIALLSDVALTIGWLKYLGWILGSLYLALYWGLAALLAGGLSRRSGLPARWTFAPAFLTIEELRGSGELGFPWFQPGYTQHEVLPALQLASLGSVTLVTVWLLLVNAALVSLLRAPRLRAAAIALALFGLPLLWGATQLAGRAPATGPRVALVQGNIPGEIKWAGTHQRQVLEAFLTLTDSAALAGAPVLVVWPETATGTYLRREPVQSVEVARLAARVGAPVLAGFAHWTLGPDGRPLPWNAAGTWAPDGSLSEVYAKRHLVPFGERVPFQRWLPALGRWDLGQAEWQPGKGPVLLPGPPAAPGPIAVLICFESIFPGIARADVRAGARLLVNLTNDEWFGNGPALPQHAAMAAFRAVEHHVPLLRCANTGITAVFDARGIVTARLPVFEPEVLVAPLPAAAAPTLYTKLGDWPGLLAALAIVVLALPPWRWTRREASARRSREPR
jgi:apolipoprotein N-acyltransferase